VWSPLRDYNYPVHRLLERTARRHLTEFHGRVLDVGCGSGPYRHLLPSDVTYVAVDRTPGPAVRLRASAEALPFEEASFDAAISTEVLEFTARPWDALAELARVVRPGGQLYVTTPFDWHVMNGPDYFRFTPGGLRRLLADAGFAVTTVEPVGGIFTALSGKLLEELLQRSWFPAARSLGIRRGAYTSAAVAALPWNLMSMGMAPLLDRLSTRSPFAVAARAVRQPKLP
jgi:SAM-dependent methyltransferase